MKRQVLDITIFSILAIAAVPSVVSETQISIVVDNNGEALGLPGLCGNTIRGTSTYRLTLK